MTLAEDDLVVFVSLNKPRDERLLARQRLSLPYSRVGEVRNPHFLVAAVRDGNQAGRFV